MPSPTGSASAAGAGAAPRLAVLDARRGEAFAALYAPSGERLWGRGSAPRPSSANGSRRCPSPRWRPDRGRYDFAMSLRDRGAEVAEARSVHRVAARDVCALAAAGPTGERLAPIYLRPPDAERWHERDTSQRAE